MPTAGRRRFIPRAIRTFLDQTLTDSELLIVDDGDDPISDLVFPHLAFKDGRLRYRRAGGRGLMSIGELRNMAVGGATGDYIAHWDDDDLSLPGRLAEQLRFIDGCGADLVGYDSILFHDSRGPEHHLLSYSAGGSGYAVGTSFFYRRSLWKLFQFEDVSIGEDNRFQAHTATKTQCGLDPVMMIATIHPLTSTPKATADDIRMGRCLPCWAYVNNPDLLQKVEALLK